MYVLFISSKAPFSSRLSRSEPNLALVVKTSPLTRRAPTPTEFSLSTTFNRWLSGLSPYSIFLLYTEMSAKIDFIVISHYRLLGLARYFGKSETK